MCSSRQRSKYISGFPRLPSPGPRAQGSHGSHPHQQKPGLLPLRPWGARRSVPSRLPPLRPPFPLLRSGSPLPLPQPHTEEKRKQPRARVSDFPTLRPGSRAVSRGLCGRGISPPAPRSSVTLLPLASSLPSPSPAPPPHGETSQKRAEKKFRRKVGPQAKRGESAGRREGARGTEGEGKAGAGWGW